MNNQYFTLLEKNLNSVDSFILDYDERENIAYESLFKSIDTYANEKELINTAIALRILRGACVCGNEKINLFKSNYSNRLSQYWHAMEVTHMLIDLHLKLNNEDEDILLAVCLLHVLDKLDIRTELREKIQNNCFLNPRVFYTLNLCNHHKYQTTIERINYYNAIQEDYIALLFKLADRGCFISRLYELPAGRAKEYVAETKNYFLPMCIYGKENYDQLSGVIAILMEKIRCLVDVADIITTKYEKVHQELNDEILHYLEENSRLRMEIKRLKHLKKEGQ